MVRGQSVTLIFLVVDWAVSEECIFMNASDREKVDEIMSRICKNAGVGLVEARTMLHKYVCEGKCDWYRSKSRQVGFDRSDLTESQREMIEVAVRQVMADSGIEYAKWSIHNILCPGHPRPRPGDSS